MHRCVFGIAVVALSAAVASAVVCRLWTSFPNSCDFGLPTPPGDTVICNTITVGTAFTRCPPSPAQAGWSFSPIFYDVPCRQEWLLPDPATGTCEGSINWIGGEAQINACTPLDPVLTPCNVPCVDVPC